MSNFCFKMTPFILIIVLIIIVFSAEVGFFFASHTLAIENDSFNNSCMLWVRPKGSMRASWSNHKH